MSPGRPRSVLARWEPHLSADGWLLVAATGLRFFAYGFVSVILGLHLDAVGLGPGTIGLVFTTALLGGALMTAGLTGVADRVGRKRVLAVSSALMALAGGIFALTDQLLLLLVAAVMGTISPSGREVGPFRSLEEAVLPQTTSARRRTEAFATYNVVGSGSGALGALAVGLPALFGLAPPASFRALLLGYAAIGLVLLVLYGRLSPSVEAAQVRREGRRWFGVQRSWGVVSKLMALFAVDSFGSGLVLRSIVAFWFHLRFGIDPIGLGAIFFASNLLAALSFVAAPLISRRIGLVNTMVFTHLVANALLLLVPLMPSSGLAVAAWLARSVLAQIDIPARQSYTMAIIDPEERAAAAGLLAVTRHGAAALAPTAAGLVLVVAAGLPFVLAAGLKIAYDLSLLALFGRIHPPEEADALEKSKAGDASEASSQGGFRDVRDETRR